MKAAPGQLPAGLHLVAVPIGAARDITLRALDTLAAAEVLAAEDTRTLRHLLDIHGIALGGRPLIAYHDHSDARDRERLLAPLRQGRSVAYAPEAGTPLIADPGYQLVRAAVAEGIAVTMAPGPSAAITALALSGLPTDRFLFAGFSPGKAGERHGFLAELAGIPATLVLFESPKRIHELLGEMLSTFGESRRAAVCRELTKRFEEVLRGSLGELVAALDGRDLKGEIVVVVDRADPGDRTVDLDAELRRALASMTIRDAADVVAQATGLPRREVYQAALRLGGPGSGRRGGLRPAPGGGW